MEGEEARTKFLANTPNGFDSVQGADITFLGNTKGESHLHLRFGVGPSGQGYAFEGEVPRKVLDSILKDFTPPSAPSSPAQEAFAA
jgi:hypothetical protein